MNDKPQIKLSETVVLIDAAFLNFVITDMKGYFEETLRRSLQDIDLSMLTTYLTLDAGITEGKNEVQFLFVYDEESDQLVHCHPSDLVKELNGVAFRVLMVNIHLQVFLRKGWFHAKICFWIYCLSLLIRLM